MRRDSTCRIRSVLSHAQRPSRTAPREPGQGLPSRASRLDFTRPNSDASTLFLSVAIVTPNFQHSPNRRLVHLHIVLKLKIIVF